MQKNYEQLKQYLHSEKAKPEKQILKSRELSMHTDENNIVTSYPNKDVQEERFVIRPKYRNIRIPRHRHEYIELSFMLDGEISMEIDGTPIKMSSGDICLMNKNVIHSSEKIGDDIWMFNILMTADFFDTIFMYRFPRIIIFQTTSSTVCTLKAKRKITFCIIFLKTVLNLH